MRHPGWASSSGVRRLDAGVNSGRPEDELSGIESGCRLRVQAQYGACLASDDPERAAQDVI